MLLINLLQATTSEDDSDFGFIATLTIFSIYLLYQLIDALKGVYKERADKLAGPTPITNNPDGLVYYGKNLQFNHNELHEMLMKHFPYYVELNEQLKNDFLKRLRTFIKQKIFIIRNKEGYKEMPVLLSAAAIQITFGLSHFRLPFFKYIQIHPEEYFADDSLRVLAGHVYGSTITVAWNHFYKNYQFTDGVNVGLHEMAHALYFQHMVADVFKKKVFITSFNQVMEESHEIYNGCRQSAGRLFTNNAFKNLQEFWAESLELFFEKPNQLKLLYPDLFDKLCLLLKQNPIDQTQPIIDHKRSNWFDREHWENVFLGN